MSTPASNLSTATGFMICVSIALYIAQYLVTGGTVHLYFPVWWVH